MSYADLASLKSYLRLYAGEGDTTDDVELQRSLDSASREIDQLCSRTFAVTEFGQPEDRAVHYDSPHWDRRAGAYVVEIPDLSTGVGSVEVFTWSDADQGWTVPVTLGGNPWLPVNGGPANASVWTQIRLPDGAFTPADCYAGALENTVLVKAFFGWMAVPAPVVEATLIQAARIHRRRDALFGVVNSPDGSSQTRLKAALDPDVLVLLDGLIKRWGAR